MSNSNIDQIYKDYYYKVFSYIHHRITNYHDAEDIAEEVFTKVVKKIETFDETKASLSTWMFNITRNTLIDYYRTNHENVELIDNYEYVDDHETISVTDLESLTLALKKLTQEERQIVILYYYEDHTLKEIADIMHLTYGVVKLRHNHALEVLKEEMEGK